MYEIGCAGVSACEGEVARIEGDRRQPRTVIGKECIGDQDGPIGGDFVERRLDWATDFEQVRGRFPSQPHSSAEDEDGL